jgi:hypothetical protein
LALRAKSIFKACLRKDSPSELGIMDFDFHHVRSGTRHTDLGECAWFLVKVGVGGRFLSKGGRPMLRDEGGSVDDAGTVERGPSTIVLCL